MSLDAEQIDWSAFGQALETAVKFKAALLKRGKRRGWTTCPRCGGRLEGALAGPKNHIRMACTTAGCLAAME